MEMQSFNFSLRSQSSDQTHQDTKHRLHRFLIDCIEEDGVEVSEWLRSAVVHYVDERVRRYIARKQLPLSRYDVDRLVDDLVDELTGFGPLESLLRDESVTEILVNGAQRIFIERDGRLETSDLRFINDDHVVRVIHKMLAPVGRRLDEASPMVDARLPDGSRINAVIPPLSLDGPCVSIRKFRQDLLTSSDLVTNGAIDEATHDFLREAVQRRCNILVSGGTATGKTTLLNILSRWIDAGERVVTVEDTAELQLGHEHVVRLETRPPNVEGYGEVTARELVRNALRMRPDRIVLGEVRSNEVLDVLQAMNTGHDGSMSTVHANTAADALLRLEMLVGLAPHDLDKLTTRELIATAVDLVVHLKRDRTGRRRVSEVIELTGLRDGNYVLNELFAYDEQRSTFVVRPGRPEGCKLAGLGVGHGLYAG